MPRGGVAPGGGRPGWDGSGGGVPPRGGSAGDGPVPPRGGPLRRGAPRDGSTGDGPVPWRGGPLRGAAPRVGCVGDGPVALARGRAAGRHGRRWAGALARGRAAGRHGRRWAGAGGGGCATGGQVARRCGAARRGPVGGRPWPTGRGGCPGHGGAPGWRWDWTAGRPPIVVRRLVRAGIGGAGGPWAAGLRIRLAARLLVGAPTRRTHGASVSPRAADNVRTGILPVSGPARFDRYRLWPVSFSGVHAHQHACGTRSAGLVTRRRMRGLPRLDDHPGRGPTDQVPYVKAYDCAHFQPQGR